MSKKIKYKPVKQEETIDISLAFSQASALLDQAAKKAMESNDVNALVKVADRWITIGSLLAADTEEECEDHVDTNQKTQFGFGPQIEAEEMEDENE